MKISSVGGFLNRLNLVFHAMVAVPLAGFAYVYLEQYAGRLEPILESSPMVTILGYLLPFIIMLTAGISFIAFKKMIMSAKNQHDLPAKLTSYLTVCIIRFSLLEASSIIAVIGLFLTGQLIYTVMYVTLLIIYSLNRPTVYRIAKELQLSGSERDIVIKKREIK